MSKKKTTTKPGNEQAEAAGEDAGFPSVAEEAAAPDTADEKPQRAEADAAKQSAAKGQIAAAPRKRGGFVAWLAFVAAVAALAAAGFDFRRDRAAASDAAMTSVTASIRALQESLDNLQQSVSALSGQLAERDDEIANIGRSLADRTSRIESLGERLSTMEVNVASLQGISSGARDAWLRAEAEYYMQIANAQLRLAGNPQLARHALELADERIRSLANPALTDVRRALSDEMRALERMEMPDTAGVTLTLASLADQVDSLPLKMQIDLDDDADATVDPELSGTERALASLKSVFTNVVSVRRTDEALKPLIAPEAQYFLKANLALQLQAARLAALRGEDEIFRQSLDDATSWLEEYYDSGSTAVQSALQTIAGIRGSVFSRSLPDISESLRLLRQFNALAEARAAPAIEPAEELPAEPEQ